MLKTPSRQLRYLRGNRIAMVYQDPQSSLNPVLTIRKQLAEVLITHQHCSFAEAWRQAAARLERVKMPDPSYILKSYPHQLSGGMQQRVVIAMALLLSPDLVIMDEPTTGLDVTVESSVLDLLEGLRSEFKMAILYISHNLGVVSRICDRVGVMYARELVEQASKRDLFSQPHHPYTLSLLRCLPQKGIRHTQELLYSIPSRVPPLTTLPPGCTFAPRCPLANADCAASLPQLEAAHDDHMVRCFRWQALREQLALVAASPPPTEKTAVSASQDLLRVSRLKVHFKQAAGLLGLGRPRQIRSVEEVSFRLGSQQTLGIVGESGCGKSTIARALKELNPITAGEVIFAEHDFARPLEQRSQNALKQMQIVFQNPDSTLNPRHTVRRALSRPLRLFQIVTPQQETEHLIGLLKAVNLDDSYLDRLPRQLSGGEKQRVAIARAIAGGPQIILCDEPISAQDVSVQAAVLNLYGIQGHPEAYTPQYMDGKRFIRNFAVASGLITP